MDDKATSNYEAAKLLFEKSFFDSSASRAYYAAYLKAWHLLEDVLGENPPDETYDGHYYWRHRGFHETLCDKYGMISPFQMNKWERLYGRRVKADYYPDEITKEEAKKSVIIAFEFLEHFTNEEKSYETRD
ncbi:MAG: HEPN domain-containing protein [Deltaproteobacteria bacterium]|nr:HEPN domain-containing protein [Deltaproteobacteria bacterium]